MTADELVNHFNRVFGISHPWPKTYVVDADTYGYCCQKVFDWRKEKEYEEYGEWNTIEVALGLTKNGLMFKNVELILK